MPQLNLISLSSILANARGPFVTFIKTGKVACALCAWKLTVSPNSLTTWLAHSKKKTCDVCKHPYSFTKGSHYHKIYRTFSDKLLSVCTRYAHKTSNGFARSKTLTTCLACHPLHFTCHCSRHNLVGSASLGDSMDMADVFFDGRINVSRLLASFGRVPNINFKGMVY